MGGTPVATGRSWTDYVSIPDDFGGYNDMVEVQPGTLLISTSKKTGDKIDLRVQPVTVRTAGEAKGG